MLQIKEIPTRPSEFDGALCLFGVAEGLGEAEIRERLQEVGAVLSYEAGAGSTPAIVRFSQHLSAQAAKQAASVLTDLCAGSDTLYNERSYDGRQGEKGLDDDNGRGWYALSLFTLRV